MNILSHREHQEPGGVSNRMELAGKNGGVLIFQFVVGLTDEGFEAGCWHCDGVYYRLAMVPQNFDCPEIVNL